MGKVVGFFKKHGKTHPITEKSKKSDYHGQEHESRWKRSSMNDIKEKIKDEAKDSRTYKRLSKEAPTEEDSETLEDISDDEARHEQELRQIDPPMRSKELYTYHGRKGHPIIHREPNGREYIMVRAKGGGTQRLYLSDRIKKRLESKEGY